MESAPSWVWTLPFATLLLAIAVTPLVPKAVHIWEKHYVKLLVGLALGSSVVLHYGFRATGFEGHQPGFPSAVAVVEHVVLDEFTPFFVLLLSLYVISGGLWLKGDLSATPLVNTCFLALGTLLASIIGTTGASMLFLRPLLQTNRRRHRKQHIFVFFIFLVSNIGGTLLPIGDPPLFLGYLKGVPFLWTLRLWFPWLVCVTTLLTLHWAWDAVAYARESSEAKSPDTHSKQPLRLEGAINMLWLAGVVATVALIAPGRFVPGTSFVAGKLTRELFMLAFAGISLATTPRGLRRETAFTYGAIIEVGCLFIGIFLTMQPAIELLRIRGPELGLSTPLAFFWGTGLLSSTLDNAPTYQVFFETARSLGPGGSTRLVGLAAEPAIREDLLRAVSLGSVFMGAFTYIGNGPNFMVKRIAEENGVRMPSFVGYLAYSLLLLTPLFALVSLALL